MKPKPKHNPHTSFQGSDVLRNFGVFSFDAIHLEEQDPKGLKKKQIREVKKAWGHRCAYCGSDKDITIDHV